MKVEETMPFFTEYNGDFIINYSHKNYILPQKIFIDKFCFYIILHKIIKDNYKFKYVNVFFI